MKRFIFAHFIAFFSLFAVAQQRFGWGSIDERYPEREAENISMKPQVLRAWRGERVAAQAVFTTSTQVSSATITISDLKKGKATIPAAAVKKYFVRFVTTDTFGNRKDSVRVSDRLDPSPETTVAAGTVQPIWLDLHVPQEAEPGTYKGTVTLLADGKQLSLPLQLEVCNKVLPEPSQWSFHLDLWQNPYAVARYYNVPLWSQEHFDLMRPLMQMLAAAGQKVITCSVIGRPWNGQTFDPFESMIGKMKQLDGTWKYDYSVFDRWVEFMMDCGITQQIDCYTIVPWHYRFDFYDCATNSIQWLACRPGEAKYRDFIVNFLKDFSRHLREKGWFDRTHIAMDERPADQMEAAWQTIQAADPEFKIEGAANYSVESAAADRVNDISVAFEYDLIQGQALRNRKAKGKKITFYTCCGPIRPNTFTFSPPAESAYLGWHAMACNYDGYLRWAYNSWPKSPTEDTRFGSWPGGDTFLVYPGGSSIRFERLVEGIQAYEKVRLLRPSLNLKNAKSLDEMARFFAPNSYPEDKNAAALVRQANSLLWQLSK